jgi:hypothetical protein
MTLLGKRFGRCLRSRDQEKAEGGADEENVALAGKRKDKKKDMSKVKCFACHKTSHYASQCPNKKKRKNEPEVSSSVEIVEFTEKFEKEFSLMTCLSSSGCLVCEDIEAWFVDNDASRHMTGMKSVFLSFSEIDSDCYVGCGLWG